MNTELHTLYTNILTWRIQYRWNSTLLEYEWFSDGHWHSSMMLWRIMNAGRS